MRRKGMAAEESHPCSALQPPPATLLLATRDHQLVEVSVTRARGPIPPADPGVSLALLGVSPTASSSGTPTLRELEPPPGLGEAPGALASSGRDGVFQWGDPVALLCNKSGVHVLACTEHDSVAKPEDAGAGSGASASSTGASSASSVEQHDAAAATGTSAESSSGCELEAQETYADPVDGTTLAQAALSPDQRWVIALPDPRDTGVKAGQVFLFQRGAIGSMHSIRLPAYSGDAACVESNPSRNQIVFIADTGAPWVLMPRRSETFAGPMFPSGFDVVNRNEAYEEGEDEQDAVFEDGTVVMDRVLDRLHRVQQAHALMLGSNLGLQVSGKNNFGKPRSEEAMKAAGAAAGVVDDAAEDAVLLRSLGVTRAGGIAERGAGSGDTNTQRVVRVVGKEVHGDGLMQVVLLGSNGRAQPGKRSRSSSESADSPAPDSKRARVDTAAGSSATPSRDASSARISHGSHSTPKLKQSDPDCLRDPVRDWAAVAD